MERRSFLKALVAIATGPAVLDAFARIEHKRKYFPGWTPSTSYDSTQLHVGSWQQFQLGETIAIDSAHGPEYFVITGVSNGVLSVQSGLAPRANNFRIEPPLRQKSALERSKASGFRSAMQPRKMPDAALLNRFRGTVR